MPSSSRPLKIAVHSADALQTLRVALAVALAATAGMPIETSAASFESVGSPA